MDKKKALEAVRTLLEYIGENPDREGLVGTPERFLKAWKYEWGAGYDPAFIFAQLESLKNGQFSKEQYDEMIIVKDIHYASHCEHHLAIFTGVAHIGYIPGETGKIVGLSKLARVVDVFSKTLQVQERLTQQIAECLEVNLHPQGVGVVVEGLHTCMCTRGVNQPESKTITSAMKGCFAEVVTKSEFLRLIGK